MNRVRGGRQHLVVRASDSRPEGMGSMPSNTFRVHTEYVLVKSVGPKVLWVVAAETTGAGGWRIFPSSSMPKMWRSGVSPSIVREFNLFHRLWQHSFLPFGYFTELNRTVTYMTLKAKANEMRTSSP
ncbi:nitric oxide synthase [Trichonephila clavipes]|nr:nitric oxide synthase [Trichonephila clavipes]